VEFGGYHQKTQGGTPYFVNAYCYKKDGVTPDWDNLTVTISHEAAEAATDYDLGHNKVLIPGTQLPYIGGGEVGDMCLAVNKTVTSDTGKKYMVQRQYSDATAAKDNADPTGANVNPCLTNDGET